VIAEVLTGDAYVLGRSLSGMASAAAQLAGLAGAGVAVAALGARHALLVSAGCHLVAAVAVRLRLPDLAAPPAPALRPPAPALPPSAPRPGPPAPARPPSAPRPGPPPAPTRPPSAPPTGSLPAPARPSRSAVRHSLAGNRRLLADPRVRGLLLAQWLPPAFVTAAESLVVPYAAQRGYPAASAGLLLACVPVGMLAGDVAVGRFVRPATRERLVPWLVAVLGAPLLALAAGPPVTAAAALLAVTGTGFAYVLGLQRAFLEAVPESSRGQAFGLLSSGLMTVQGVGPTVFGALAQVVPAGVAIAVAGAATLVTAWWLRRCVRR
jgi:hypothetical protein